MSHTYVGPGEGPHPIQEFAQQTLDVIGTVGRVLVEKSEALGQIFRDHTVSVSEIAIVSLAMGRRSDDAEHESHTNGDDQAHSGELYRDRDKSSDQDHDPGPADANPN